MVQLRTRLRLRRARWRLKSSSRVQFPSALQATSLVNPVRINEVINGRPYVIEVSLVARDRWRAQLSRKGATTALMPFYGSTPDEAAQHLTSWLTRASRLAAPPATRA
jgi:hypothetical protein